MSKKFLKMLRAKWKASRIWTHTLWLKIWFFHCTLLCKNVDRNQHPTSAVNNTSKPGNFGTRPEQLCEERETLNWWLPVTSCLPFMNLHFQKLCKEAGHVCKAWVGRRLRWWVYVPADSILEILSSVYVSQKTKNRSFIWKFMMCL